MALLLAYLSTLASACGNDETNGTPIPPSPSGPALEIRLEPVLQGLAFPVAMAEASDGRIFYNERLTGAIRIINPGWQLASTPFCQLAIQTAGEQGLLGLALDPSFASTPYVYVYATAGSPLRNRVLRYTETGGTCTQETVILDNLPANSTHNGGLIQFGPDGKLYVQLGDAQNSAAAQDIASLAGKILRVNPDGSAPSDNPFFANANPEATKIWSLGHRNGYGFTFHAVTGHLWQTENGPSDNDEINRIVPGGNYGWPTVRGIANNPSFRDPILTYTPPIAPTGIVSVPNGSPVYPTALHNNLLFVAFNDGRVRRIVLSGPDLDQLGGTDTPFNGGQGGLLSLLRASDGYIYVSNSNTIFRLVAQ